MKLFKKSLFIFHRDLRISDNRGLQKALAESQEVVPVFIFDPLQVEESNLYRSIPALQFMVESLEDLALQVGQKGGKLFLFYGSPEKIVDRLLKEEVIDAVFSNRDYTPFAQQRDRMLAAVTKKAKAVWISVDDALLCNPDKVLSGKGTPYTVYTAFLKKVVGTPVEEPFTFKSGIFQRSSLSGEITLSSFKKKFLKHCSDIAQKGGRTEAQKILKQLKEFKKYSTIRDYPSQRTTGLSAHLKFGTVSAREVWHAVRKEKADPQLLKQLYWRDFFTYLAYHFPHVFGKAFREKYQKLHWQKNEEWFKRWCEGTTGFPLVDAGMRQLNATGYMHNRVRMIVASFLTKDMHVDWRKGERYFAQRLVDYDPCVNNGNWQWAASTGADAQPYFRIFNPWLQQKKFDPDCTYIKQWISELSALTSKEIHAWYKASSSYKGYPVPLLDHSVESKKAIQRFKACEG